MELRLQPKPEVNIQPAHQGIVSREEFFVKKQFEKINQYFFPAHFIRTWKPKAELLYPLVSNEAAIQYECDFNRDVQNCFVEDNAEEVYLRAPPPCFVVIGKYGASVRKLSKQLAEEFGSVLIDADDVINRLLQTQTETAKVLNQLLRLGVSLTLNFVLALASYMAHTAEARHKGYVLCGLPCIPQSFDLPVEQQFNYLFTWDNKPTVFINVLFHDEDLIKERTSSRCEVVNSTLEKCFICHIEEKAESENEAEDTDDELLPVEENRSSELDIDISPSRPWVQLPGDEESQVWSELELFDNKVRPSIELIISRVDPQYFITVDSRLQNEFEVVMARLSLLQVWKVPEAVPFIAPKRHDPVADKNDPQEEEENEDEEQEEQVSEIEIDPEIKAVMNEPPQTAFLTLFTKNTISPKFRWELSHYNYVCPVSLREGEVIEGKSEFAVVFTKYIYFMRNEDSMLKFLRNPRAYVLPVLPQPPNRFIIIGYPYTGKTTLANSLANEMSIPVLDANIILKNDLDRKKTIYQEFCRQKAECRENIRLHVQAWQEWRMEEEHRINLIEEWVAYIQTLLCQRIEQFYCKGESEGSSVKETQVQRVSSAQSDNAQLEPEGSENSETRQAIDNLLLQVCGVSLNVRSSGHRENNTASPSEKLIKAMKHEDFDFNEPYLEVEANLFFSSLWNSFSNEDQRRSSGNISKIEEEICEESMYHIQMVEEEEEVEEESITVDWCSLLPPQSLSSFLMSKIPYTTREKRQSFKIFLEAASKAYWTPCKLKTEFTKWRLPCFMDIPLCEIFLDNPILLLKYVPEWLKERPLFPDPVDPMHPSILEAGREAFFRANVVTVKQNEQEIAILLRDAIEKAEREGMRVTGEVISPGGWIMDNMPLNLNVWKKLACEGIFPDYIYILVDSDPECKRIINTWSRLYRTSMGDSESSSEEEEEEEEEETQDEQDLNKPKKIKPPAKVGKLKEALQQNIIEMIKEIVKLNAKDDNQLDDILNQLLDKLGDGKEYIPPISVDPFSHHIFENTIDTWFELKEETATEEALMTVHTLTHYTTISFFDSLTFSSAQSIPLGPQLQKFTQALLNLFIKKQKAADNPQPEKLSLAESLQFFMHLLTLPEKLQNLKDWLISVERGGTVSEFDIVDFTPNALLFDIRKILFEPFIKRPRELEDFEMNEILKWERKQKKMLQAASENWDDEAEADEEEELGEEEEEEDIRIFGESGPLCVVNLRNDIFLPGKPEFSLRYFGKLYYFYNEEAKKRFISNPQKYAPYYSVIRGYPPLRIYVTGPTGCGKTKLSTSIGNQFSLCFVDYLKFLVRNVLPHTDPELRKFTPLEESKLLISENYNAEAKLVKEKFMNAPYEVRQFWIENPVYEELLEGKNKFNSKIIDLSKPIVSKNFPELSYQNLEKDIYQDNEEDRLRPTPSAEETPYITLKELDANITRYLQYTDELNDYCVDRSTKVLWTTEPYLTQGFILEGFPLRFSDTRHVAENNWIPDLILEMKLPENMVLERNVNILMEEWDTQLKQEVIEEKLLEETLSSVQRIWNFCRRNQLLAEKREALRKQLSSQVELKNPNETPLRRSEAEVPKSEENNFELSDELEEQIQAEVDQTLKAEFRELTFNPVFETYENGKARITDNLVNNYRKNLAELEKVKTFFSDLGVPWIEVDNSKEIEENMIDAFHTIDKTRKRLNLKGEFAFTVKPETAEKLLKQGFYFLSKFGRWCPVQVYRMKNPIHMYRPLSAKGKITPIAYRNYIYFVAGESEKVKFIEDPVKYTFNEPHHPNIPLRVAVIGPPKSGKSTLCGRLGRTFDLKVVTMGSALRFVLEKIPNSTLAKSINNYLRRGCFLPLRVKVEALLTSLNEPNCATQGFVFDGIPFDAALTQSLAERGKLPFVIISLVADPDFGKTNRQNLDLTEFRLPYKNRVNLDSRYKDWNETYKRFSQWNQNTYNNLYEVNAKLNVVDIFYRAYDIIRKSFFGILYYVEYCVTNKAVPLHYLCVGQHEYELRKSSFHNNCPVCWVEQNRLNNSSDPPPRSGLVQYLNYFYWVCPNHMEKFLQKPKMYVPPEVPAPPQPFPRRITRAKYESYSPSPSIHGYGRCPVTRIDFPDSLDWEGSWQSAAFYDEKVYLCKNEEMLARFLSKPWRYSMADTQFEVNRPVKSDAVKQLGPPKVTSLPPIGFLEQTVADSIHECLQILGSVRPVYINMTPATTGCTFLALFLKVHNKRNKNRDFEKQYYDFMYNNCRANKFRVMPYKRPGPEMGMGDFDSGYDKDLDSESSEEEKAQGAAPGSVAGEDQPCWVDFEAQADKQMWSAKVQPVDQTEMKLTSDDELLEIPEIPRAHVVLKYQTYTLRSNPLPGVPNCLAFLYSISPPLEVLGEFNYRTLYQPPPHFSSPYPVSVPFNPEKNFNSLLHKESQPGFESTEDLVKGDRAYSNDSLASTKHNPDMDPDLKLMLECFIPRFQLLDRLTSVKVPPLPETVDEEPIIFNPHRDYSYILLLADFFRTSHVLRCFEWDESTHQLEFSNRMNKNLGLTNVQVDYFLRPKITRSVASRRSFASYMDAFDAATEFWPHPDVQVQECIDEDLRKSEKEKSSLMNFIQAILLEKLDELFSRVSLSTLSYDSYEMNFALSDSDGNEKKGWIVIREIFPYPPLPWDIISRPYYAYCSIPAIFQPPLLDEITHERHFSVLDGITETNEEIRFVRYPSWVRVKEGKKLQQQPKPTKKNALKDVYVYYDLFNFYWTSFLTYPFSWAYNKDVKGHFCEYHGSEDSPFCMNL